jgi:hypothetical protein
MEEKYRRAGGVASDIGRNYIFRPIFRLTPCLTNLYWKHVDVGTDHTDTLNQLNNCFLINTTLKQPISHQILDRAKGITRNNNNHFIYLDELQFNNDFIHIGVLANYIGNYWRDYILKNYNGEIYVNPAHLKESLLYHDKKFCWHKIHDSHKDFVRKVNPKKKNNYQVKKHSMKRKGKFRRNGYTYHKNQFR